MKHQTRTVRLVAGSLLAFACLCGTPGGLCAQTNWSFENGTAEGFTLRSRNFAPAAPNDPTVAGDESLTGARLLTGLPVAGLAWSVGNFNQYNGQIRAVPNNGIVNPSDTNLMTYGAAFPAGPNARGQTNYLNTFALNQNGDSIHWATNDQIAKSPVVTLPANAVLGVWAYGGGGAQAPVLDVAGEEYTTGSAGVAVRSAADDSLLASVRILNGGALLQNAVTLYPFAGQQVYLEVVDAFQGGFGWLAVDEILVTQNAINLAPDDFTFEAEDFNFDNGLFLDNPNLYTPDPTNCYYQKGSTLETEGVDYHEVNPTVHFGVGGIEWRYDGFNVGFARLPQTTNSFDAVRSQYVTAGVADYDMANNALDEWWNYTRTFPATNNHLYARVASAGPFSIRVDMVSNATVSNQTLVTRGWFIGNGSGSTALYQMVPLTDITGTNQLVVAFDGTPKTLRLTALTGGFRANFYVLDPTNLVENLIPTVSITSHTNNQVVNIGVATTIMATATDDGTVTNVQFYAGNSAASLTLIGEDNTSPFSADYTPTGNEGKRVIRVVATDHTGLVSSKDITLLIFDTSFVRVPTTVGNGADNRIIEADPNANGGATTNPEIRRGTTGQPNHRAYVMRFDLSGYNLAAVAEATLNVYSGRQYTAAPFQVLLLGILPSATNHSNPHTIATYLESALTYSNMPGMLPPDWNAAGSPPTTVTLLSYDWDTNHVVLIETNYFRWGQPGEDELENLGTPSLTQYLRSQAGKTNVVIMLEVGEPSNLLARLTSKEQNFVEAPSTLTGAVGEFAPFLRFKLVLIITSYSLTGNQLTLSGAGGTPSGSFTVKNATDPTTPLGSWSTWTTGTFSTNGTFSVTNTVPGGAQSYFIISVP